MRKSVRAALVLLTVAVVGFLYLDTGQRLNARPKVDGMVASDAFQATPHREPEAAPTTRKPSTTLPKTPAKVTKPVFPPDPPENSFVLYRIISNDVLLPGRKGRPPE